MHAPKKTQEFLSGMKFVFPEGTVKVSGTAQEKKNSMLQKQIRDYSPEINRMLKAGEKILFIVNSYEQSKIAGNCLASIVKGSFKVRYLVKDTDELKSNRAMYRKDLTEFKDDILVAPAIIMERGHNIVNDLGNAHLTTLVIGIRPMTDPDNYRTQNSKVNGYIMSKYYGTRVHCDIGTCKEIRRDAAVLSYKLRNHGFNFEQLDDALKTDIYITLFCMIIQLIGRISRVGEPDQAAIPPKVIFLDGAFNSGKTSFKDFMISYMNQLTSNEKTGIIANALYNPFYLAIKGD